MRIHPRQLYRLSIALLAAALVTVVCHYQSRLRLLESDYEKLGNSEMSYPSFLPVYRSEAANLRFHNRVYRDQIVDLNAENARLRAELAEERRMVKELKANLHEITIGDGVPVNCKFPTTRDFVIPPRPKSP